MQDLYIEKLDGKGNYQAIDGAWKPLAVDHEVIHVRGGKDVTLDVQSTAHGPLLNPILPNETPAHLAKWTLYDPALNTLPLYQLNVASNWTEFSAALGVWCWPTQNVVYSDDQGHIAYHAVGRVPLRPAGLQGLPIQDADARVAGLYSLRPHAQRLSIRPRVFWPPPTPASRRTSRLTRSRSSGSIPTASERIYKALQGRDQLTPPDMLAVQTDVYSEVDQEIGHRLAYAIDHTPGEPRDRAWARPPT